MHLGETVGAISADPARLQQILWNILKNAVKFTPTQGAVRISTERISDNRCEVRIQDNGIGISPSVLPLIFEAFEQGETHINRQFGGLGLGLTITRALVNLHGGRIRAESPGSGQGSTFSIEFPACPPPPVAVPKPDPGSNPTNPLQLRILLVEDHADTSRTLSRFLRRAGFEVVTASHYTEALSVAERERVDLLISDLGLPDGNGHDLMRAMRAQSPVWGIAMSGYGMKEDLQRSREAGFAEHLVKPVRIADLIATIRRVTSQQMDSPLTDPKSD